MHLVFGKNSLFTTTSIWLHLCKKSTKATYSSHRHNFTNMINMHLIYGKTQAIFLDLCSRKKNTNTTYTFESQTLSYKHAYHTTYSLYKPTYLYPYPFSVLVRVYYLSATLYIYTIFSFVPTTQYFVSAFCVYEDQLIVNRIFTFCSTVIPHILYFLTVTVLDQ